MKPNTVDTNEHRVTSDETELPRGSYFYLWPATRLDPGQLAMIETPKGVRLIGRWYPAVAGCNWIVQPGRIVQDTRSQCRILGAVIPCEDPPKQITNLSEAECERFLNPFPRSL
jgi:hypothetical protein